MHSLLRFGLTLMIGSVWTADVLAQQLGLTPAIVQRITPADFQFWEHQRGLSFSRSYDIVICQLYPDPEPAVERVLAIKVGETDGEAFVAYSGKVRYGGDREPPMLQRHDISPTIARQIRASLRRLLEYQVYRPTGKPYVGTPNDSWWIFLRTGKQEAIAGTVLHGGLHRSHSDESRAFNALVDGMSGLFEGPPEDRDRVLTELDRMSAVFAKTGKP